MCSIKIQEGSNSKDQSVFTYFKTSNVDLIEKRTLKKKAKCFNLINISIQTDSFKIGQDFVKNSPNSVDSLSCLDLNSGILQLDIGNKVPSSEMGHCLSPNRNNLSPSTEGLLVQDAPKMQYINQTFSTSTNSAFSSSEQNHLISGKNDSLQRESLRFMKGVMDECTHVANFSGTC